MSCSPRMWRAPARVIRLGHVRTFAGLIVGSGCLWVLPSRAVAQSLETPAAADTIVLTLDVARRIAVHNSPTYLAAQQSTAAAQGALRQSRLLRFNPDVELQTPGGGANASPYQLAVTQEIEWAGQRTLRIGAAHARAKYARADARDVGRRMLLEVTAVYSRAVATAERRRVAEEQAALTQRLLAAVRIQAREGEISTLEASLAEVEGARAQARVFAFRRDAARALLELTRLIGVIPGTPVRLAEPVTVDSMRTPSAVAAGRDSLIITALAKRPDLLAAQSAIREAQQLAALARREAIPNLKVGALGERDRNGRGTPRVGATVGFTLPLFNRNQGLHAEREADVRRARIEAQSIELQVHADVLEALHAYELTYEELRVFHTAVLTPARENGTRLQTAYTAGKINLATLLLLRSQLLDAELGYWDAWLTQRDAHAQLHAAVGMLDADAIASSDTAHTHE